MALFRRETVQTAASGGLETLLGSSTNFQGVLKSDGNIRIDGILQGRIETAGNLVIGPTARVSADILANAVQVWGYIQGNIRTMGRLEILSTGRVFGEVTVGSLMIDEGGLFRGQCFMDGQDVDELAMEPEPKLLGTGAPDAGEGHNGQPVSEPDKDTIAEAGPADDAPSPESAQVAEENQ